MDNSNLVKPVVSVVLMPAPTATKELIELSREISGQMASGITLSEHFLPHITLAQMEADESILEDLWGDVSSLAVELDAVQLSGLAIIPDSRGHVWVEANVVNSDRLHFLHLTIIDIAQKHGLRLWGLREADFRPHCTLALADQGQEVSINVRRNAAILHKKIGVTLAAGLNGENFTFVKVTHLAQQ